jgi:hypothetical protein
MRPQYRAIRKIATVPAVAGSFATVDLPRDYDYETIGIRVYGGLQVTALATSVRAEAPCQVLSRVELLIDGKNAAYNAPFWYACLGNLDRPHVEANARAVTPPSGVAVATYQVEALGFVDLSTINGERPKDSNFRSAGLSLNQLRLSFGQPGDSFVGGTVAFSSMNVDVWAAQMVELPDAAGSYYVPGALRKVSYQESAHASSNANFEYRLPAGNFIRSVLVRGEGAVTAGEPSTAVVNNIILQTGLDVRFNLAANNVRMRNNGDYGAVTAGYYRADLLSLGGSVVRLSELWDVTGQTEPKAILDVTGGASVKTQAVTEEYILARQ